MPEVLNIKQAKESAGLTDDVFSWKVELPDAVKKENNLSQNAYLVLTVQEGKINGELINPTEEIKKETKRILDKYGEVFQEMKRLGD